ncbi:RNA polymerase sigma factor [Spirillospora sp. CA-294931]|uniref:RNA polymerase sigma factor n=1 Tax=Spirillospora sp. CA-294931 TaxID=3240042 RepID=UPI003D9311E2
MTTTLPTSTPDTGMPPDRSDAALIVRSRTDPEVFSALFDRYFAEIHRYVASRLGADHADDVAAEAFLAAFAQRDRYDADRPVARPWLYGIATNLVHRHRRTEKRAYRLLMRAPADPGHDGGTDEINDQLTTEQMRPHVAAALAELAPCDRDVLLLVAYSEMSYDEVGQALGVPSGTVGSRLHRARRHLRIALREGDE